MVCVMIGAEVGKHHDPFFTCWVVVVLVVKTEEIHALSYVLIQHYSLGSQLQHETSHLLIALFTTTPTEHQWFRRYWPCPVLSLRVYWHTKCGTVVKMYPYAPLNPRMFLAEPRGCHLWQGSSRPWNTWIWVVKLTHVGRFYPTFWIPIFVLSKTHFVCLWCMCVNTIIFTLPYEWITHALPRNGPLLVDLTPPKPHILGVPTAAWCKKDSPFMHLSGN